ncbi:MAG: c-type cytochrome [Sulfurimonas sp.]|nr:hypothetical protein [Sulfurimonas sp.]MDD3060404.1 hypothetical protein [Sulfurimonas sp.]MDD5203273.1 hypothetical protein [Sulfurimonas sp.]
MKYILFLLLPLFLYAQSSFITQEEYAAQLYKNPRGIGCQHCHGDKGEGRVVAKYIHKKVEKSFAGSAINNLEYAAFYKALNSRIDSMPRYFLTPKEISALYFYLNADKLKKAQALKEAQEAQKAKEAQKAEEIKRAQNTKNVQETKKVSEPLKVEKVLEKSKEENKTQKVEDVVEEPKEITKPDETIDINALFKEATEAKNAK